jgi:hypothetical protein
MIQGGLGLGRRVAPGDEQQMARALPGQPTGRRQTEAAKAAGNEIGGVGTDDGA